MTENIHFLWVCCNIVINVSTDVGNVKIMDVKMRARNKKVGSRHISHAKLHVDFFPSHHHMCFVLTYAIDSSI